MSEDGGRGSMCYTAQRANQLREHIEADLELLKQYEDLQRLSDDPKEKERCRRNVAAQKVINKFLGLKSKHFSHFFGDRHGNYANTCPTINHHIRWFQKTQYQID